MAAKKRTDEELVKVLSSQIDDAILSEDYPISEVEEGLRQAGADPNEIGRWGTTLVAELAKKRRLACQASCDGLTWEPVTLNSSEPQDENGPTDQEAANRTA